MRPVSFDSFLIFVGVSTLAVHEFFTILRETVSPFGHSEQLLIFAILIFAFLQVMLLCLIYCDVRCKMSMI